MRPLAILACFVVLGACASVPTRDLRPGEVVPAPTAWKRYPPFPPKRVAIQEVETSATVDLMVEGNGRVSDVRVLELTPADAETRFIINTLKKWEYRAPVVDGVRIRRRTAPLTIRYFYYPCAPPQEPVPGYMDICTQ